MSWNPRAMSFPIAHAPGGGLHTLKAGTRVKLTGGRTIAPAGPGEFHIGLTEGNAGGEQAIVDLRAAPVQMCTTRRIEPAAVVYAATGGGITDEPVGPVQGLSLELATAGQTIYVLPIDPRSGTAASSSASVHATPTRTNRELIGTGSSSIRPSTIAPAGESMSVSRNQTDPVAQIDALVREKQQRGMDARRARLAVAREQPELMEAANYAVSAAQNAKRLRTDTQGAPAAPPDVVKLFNARVRALVETGMTKSLAVRSVVKADPDLHRQFVAACNPGKRFD